MFAPEIIRDKDTKFVASKEIHSQKVLTNVDSELQLVDVHEQVVVDHEVDEFPGLHGSCRLRDAQKVQVFVTQTVHQVVQRLLPVRVPRKVRIIVGSNDGFDGESIIGMLDARRCVVMVDYVHFEAVVQRQDSLHGEIPARRRPGVR